MTRPLRVEYPGAFYHVYSRGNAGEKVFNGKRDKAKFLEYISKVTERFSVFVGKSKENEWLETGGLLGHFGRKLKESITNYKSYVEEVDEGPIKNPSK